MFNLIRRSLLFLSIIGCFACAILWFVSKPSAREVDETLYVLRAYSQDQDKINAIKKKAESGGYEVEVQAASRFRKKKIGIRLVLRNNDIELLKNANKRLQEKGVETRLVLNDPGEGNYVQVNGNFPENNRSKIEKKKENVSAILENIYEFQIEDNFKKEPYKTTAVIVKKVQGAETVEALKAELSGLAPEEIEYEKMEIRESGSGDKDKTVETPEPGKAGSGEKETVSSPK